MIKYRLKVFVYSIWKGVNMKKTMILIILLNMILFFNPVLNGLEKSCETEIVTIKKITPFTYCVLSHKGPYTEIESVIGQFMQAFFNQSLAPTGPMIGVYYNDPREVKPEELEWEIGFPVTEQAQVLAPLEKKTVEL